MIMKIQDTLERIIDNRGKTPPIVNEGNYLLEINCIATKRKFPDYDAVKKHVSEETYATWFRSGHPQKGDILIPTVGTLDAIGFMDRDDCCIAQNLIAFRTNPSICNSEYLFYLLCDPTIRKKLLNLDIGGVQPSIKVPHLKKLEVEIPKLEIQNQVVKILKSIDDKIENNNEINRNLYEQINTLCKAWLSDYEPFGGECPEDWEITPLSDIAEFISGYSYKGNELVEDSNVAMATIKNFERKGGFKLEGYKPINPSSKLKETQHVELFDTLVAHTDLTQNADVIGNAELVLSKSGYDDIVFSMDLVKVLPKEDSVSKFLLAALLHSNSFKQHCLGYVNGTTVLHLSKKALSDYELPLPRDLSVLQPLSEILEALYKQISINIESNVELEKLRDSLLPKLMSGEFDVSDLEV